MRSSPDRPGDDRRLLALALVLSVLIHFMAGGVAGFFEHRVAPVLAKLVPHPRQTPELVATSDVITLEKRVVPRETHPVLPAPRPVPRVVRRPVVAAAPRAVPRPTTVPTPTARPRPARIHRPRPVRIAQTVPAPAPPARAAARGSALSPQQIAALDEKFSETIAHAHASLTDVPKQTAPPSTMKRYDLLLNGKPEDVEHAEGECIMLQPPDTRGETSYVYYQCSIVYSDGYRETVAFPWPFRFARGHVPMPGQVFSKQGPPEGFVLPRPFYPSRAVCSYYKAECAAVIARERAEGAPETWTPREDK